ncbi:MAG: ISL3 family transposase [Bacteroidales bacterium]|jgi:transposase
MSTSMLYYTQGIRDFQHQSVYYPKDMVWNITRNPKKFKCPVCFSSNVRIIHYGYRDIRGMPMGARTLTLRVKMHRIKCRNCYNCQVETLPFLPSPKCHFTKYVANYALELRKHMTISATAKHLELHWCTVKDIEKSYLRKKYSKIKLKDVENIGIDEVYIGAKHGFLTIVRELLGGRVLFVGEGKSADSLEPFMKKLKRAKVKLKNVAIDMGNAYSSWVKENHPDCNIVYDHFHVIKSMNDKLNSVRRRTMNKLAEDERKILKGKRFTLLKNIENLDESEKADLGEIRDTYWELGEMSMMKECLRNIYAIAETAWEAEIAFKRWCELAVETGIKELKTMAKTIKQRFNGIIAFWHTGFTSASMEGFNNKIGWLQRQAYGYRDLEYFKLKIYDLPKLKIIKDL